ncbi:MAG: hypothetical protein GWP59_01210 [Chlamydiales bacterium]|nr:hypothetical protein [Chlamydiales bacterium]NCF70296.1 hypothetical protein [Chlamydiales bacterium]
MSTKRRLKSSYTPRFIHLLEKIFIHSWWLVLFLFSCFCLHQYLSYQQHQNALALDADLKNIEKEIAEEQKRQKYLQEQTNSHNDYLWNERVLKKELGLKGKEEKKIYFK